MTDEFWNGICPKCFYEVQEKKGCVCPMTKARRDEFYFCSFCGEFHRPGSPMICKKCARRQDLKKEGIIENVFFSVVLPSMAAGIIIGFFLCWLFIKIRRKNRRKLKEGKEAKKETNISF